MQLPEARLHLVADPSDQPDHDRFIKSLADDAAGRVVCEIRPGARGTLAWLAETMLQGLGKRPDRAGHGRNAQLSWRRAIVWSIVGDLRQLFVSRAHLLHARDIKDLIDLAALANAELWLIVQGERLPRPAREALALLPLRRWNYPAFQKHWKQQTKSRRQARSLTKKAKPSAPYQQVPDDEFPTFLAACDVLLTAAEVRAIESDLASAAEQLEQWLNDRKSLEAEAFAGFLVRLVEPLQNRAEMTVALRAAQIVLFERGYLLKLDVDRLLAKRESLPSIERAPEFAEPAATYADPSFPAQAALCLLLGDRAPELLPKLNLEHVALDTTAIDLSGDDDGDATADVPESLLAFLRAQRLLRLFEGAADADPLFVSEEKTPLGQERPLRRRSWHAIQQATRKVASETGVPLVLRYSGTSERSRRRWNYGLGISLQALPPLRRRPKARHAA